MTEKIPPNSEEVKDEPDITIERVNLENTPSLLEEIALFYNRHLTKSPHTQEYKDKIYRKKSLKPIILISKDQDKIIALLETWLDRKDKRRRLLSTIIIDPEYQNKGFASKLINECFEIAKDDPQDYNWVVNFRESNIEKVVPFYQKFGFDNPHKIGQYANGENMWEMERMKEIN